MLLDALTPAARATEADTVPEGRDAGPSVYHKLESLRGVAACLVALHHSPLLVGAEAGVFIASSYLFVDFFFILSGFVMTHAYRERITCGMPFKTYAALRVARLLPLHVFAHLLYAASVLGKWALYSLGVGGVNPADSVHVPSFFTNLFLLQAFGVHDYLYWNRPSWSISAELGAYVVFFVLTTTLDRRGRILPPIALSFLLYAGLLAWDDSRMDLTFDLGFVRCIAGFYLGSALYRIHATLGARRELRRSLQTLAEVGCALVIAFCVSHVPESDVYVAGAIIAFALAIAVFSSTSKGVIGALLERPLLRKIGLWSYSIYLLHLVCFETAANVAERALGLDSTKEMGMLAVCADVIVLGLIIGLSSLTYEWIEKPFRSRFKARLLRDATGATPAARSAA